MNKVTKMMMMSNISTHALREEGDCLPQRYADAVGNFYPRPPRGGRQNNPIP